MKEILRVKNAVRVYGSTRAVNGACLTVHRGERVLIHGPRGCGKTTLLRLIAGIESPDDGSITAPDHLGVVQEEDGLIPEYTLAENIALPLTLQRERQGEKKVRALLARLGLEYIAGAKPPQATRLECRLAVLARAWIATPPLLLLDEWTAGLGERESTTLWDGLRVLAQEDTTMVFFSTNPCAGDFFDRYFAMKFGQITEEAKR